MEKKSNDNGIGYRPVAGFAIQLPFPGFVARLGISGMGDNRGAMMRLALV